MLGNNGGRAGNCDLHVGSSHGTGNLEREKQMQMLVIDQH